MGFRTLLKPTPFGAETHLPHYRNALLALFVFGGLWGQSIRETDEFNYITEFSQSHSGFARVVGRTGRLFHTLGEFGI